MSFNVGEMFALKMYSISVVLFDIKLEMMSNMFESGKSVQSFEITILPSKS